MKHEIGHLNMIGLARNASQSSLAKNVKCDMTWPVGQPMRSCKSCGTDCLCVKRPNKTWHIFIGWPAATARASNMFGRSPHHAALCRDHSHPTPDIPLPWLSGPALTYVCYHGYSEILDYTHSLWKDHHLSHWLTRIFLLHTHSGIWIVRFISAIKEHQIGGMRLWWKQLATGKFCLIAPKSYAQLLLPGPRVYTVWSQYGITFIFKIAKPYGCIVKNLVTPTMTLHGTTLGSILDNNCSTASSSS